MSQVRFSNREKLLTDRMLMKKIELSLLKKQIEVVGTFLPDEILKGHHAEHKYVQNMVGVLVLFHVSGFAQLMERHFKSGKGGIYELTASLNAYFGAIIQVLDVYGGDVLYMSGGVMVTMWKVTPDDSLVELLHEVAVCLLVIQRYIGEYETEVNVVLRLRISVSAGNMSFAIIGSEESKSYLLVGEAWNHVYDALAHAEPGDTILSPSAWSQMLQERYAHHPRANDAVKVINVYYKPSEGFRKAYFEEKQEHVLKLIEIHFNHKKHLQYYRSVQSNRTEYQIVMKFLRSLPRRSALRKAARFWPIKSLKPLVPSILGYQIEDNQPVDYLTELREITVQVIHIIPKSFTETAFINLVSDVQIITSETASKYSGVVMRMTVLSKDIYYMVLFGLRSEKHVLENQYALRAAYEIRNLLIGVPNTEKVSIAITLGLVYSGVIGHPTRREYLVTGTAINRAILLTSNYPQKVCCDFKVYKRSKLASFYFQLQKMSKTKGFEEIGNVFEYDEQDVLSVGSSEKRRKPTKLIGRNPEFNFIRAMINQDRNVNNFNGICIHGASFSGKSTILKAVFEAVSTGSYNVAYIELAGSSKIPYFCVSNLYTQLYDQKAVIDSQQMRLIYDLPRDLFNYEDEIQDKTEDIALIKYKILNHFRDMCRFTECPQTLLIIDNVQDIDLQSWEILELTFAENSIKLITGGSFELKQSWELKFKISLLEKMLLHQLLPLEDSYVAELACMFLDAAGISSHLVAVLIKCCLGLPGHIQLCLLHLTMHEKIIIKFLDGYGECDEYIFPDTRYTDSGVCPVIGYAENYKTSEDITIDDISLDLLDSYQAFPRLVIKTASVLGPIFPRSVLKVALKYPVESNLTEVIQQLFEHEIFECGSRYVYADALTNTTRVCCQCYFEEDEIQIQTSPKYGYCKLLHFKNKSLKEVAYQLVPANQKTELHLLCTEIMEKMTTSCPNCSRAPSINHIHIYTYKDLSAICSGIDAAQFEHDDVSQFQDVQEILRKYMKHNYNYNQLDDLETEIYKPVFNRKVCKCVQIFCRVYNDLRYHSKAAGHVAKLIFFTAIHGFLLYYLYDYGNSIATLTEAREICLRNTRTEKDLLDGMYKMYHLNLVEMGLALCCADLRKVKEAKAHLVIALRQVNIPSVAFCYKFYGQLLTRTFLVNKSAFRSSVKSQNFLKKNVSICLACAAKVFAMEGNWSFAKHALAHSLYILKTLNGNTSILYDYFCNVIEFFIYSAEKHECEKLRRFALREFQKTFAFDSTMSLNGLRTILTEIFLLKCIEGDLEKSIRLGYRVLDVEMRLNYPIRNTRLLRWLSLLLIFNFRIIDFAAVNKLLKVSIQEGTIRHLDYCIINIMFYLYMGLEQEPIEGILAFGEKKFRLLTKMSWKENLFVSLIKLYYLRRGKYFQAEEYTQKMPFSYYNIGRDDVLIALMANIEIKTLTHLRSRRIRNPYVQLEIRQINYLLKLLKYETDVHYKIYRPNYFIMKAWISRINNRNKKSKKMLRKALEISKKQHNVLIMAQIMRLQNSWLGKYSHYNVTPSIGIHEITTYTLEEWSAFLPAYPIF